MTDPDNNAPFRTGPDALAAAVRWALRPLVGLLLEHGLTYPWLNGVLKSVFVDVADKEFRLRDKRQTDSRVTLLTGVHRKDVRRLRPGERQGGDGEEETPENVYLGAQLISIWTSDTAFVDETGCPRPLARLPRDGELDFGDLVTRASKDIRPRSVLDEWLRLGAVEVGEDDYVRLKTEAFIPAEGFEEKAYFMGQNVHDHVDAACYNIQGGEPPMLERSVYYDELSEESARELQDLARREGAKLLKLLNERARALQRADRAGRSADRRFNFGVYFNRELDV